MTATLLPPAEITLNDSNGKPLAGGSVFYYIPGTTTKKNTWQDPAQTILNTNPIILDSSGRAIVWGSGTYRQVVYDQFGNLIWDQITEDSSAGLIGNLTDDEFIAGTDFTPGTTSVLTLSSGPGSIANTWIYFDSLYQDDSQVQSLSGVTLTFNAPIPVGVTKVTVKIGNTVAVGTPGNATVTDATVAPSAGIQSSKLSYLAPFPGAVAETVLAKLAQIVSVKDFGAKGDGSTNDTAAMQAAHNTGRLIYYPDGTYIFTTITIAQGGIVGDGIGQTILSSSDTTSANLITYTGATFSSGTPLFEGFLLQVATPTQKTTGVGIYFIPASGEVQYATIYNIMVLNVPTGISFKAASKFAITDSRVYNYSGVGILVDNTNVADSGDSSIVDCFISTTEATGIAIQQNASGGLKIVNTKLVNGAAGYVLAFNGTTTTGDLLISNTSIENMTGFAVYLSRTSGANTFGAIVFSNLQIANCGGSGGGGSGGIGTDSSGAFSQIVISGSNIEIAPGTGACISLLAVDTFTIDAINCVGNTGSQTGIALDASCNVGTVGAVTYRNLANPLVNNCANASIQQRIHKGSVNVTCTTAYGSLFTGSAPVSFPAGKFLLAPEVMATPNAGGSLISAGAESASISGCTIVAISNTNGGVVTVGYIAMSDF
jgi:hypothetical protein